MLHVTQITSRTISLYGSSTTIVTQHAACAKREDKRSVGTLSGGLETDACVQFCLSGDVVERLAKSDIQRSTDELGMQLSRRKPRRVDRTGWTYAMIGEIHV